MCTENRALYRSPIPLGNVIREKLIPALVGRRVSDIERRILALPVRLGRYRSQ